jgi:hypothetical protein
MRESFSQARMDRCSSIHFAIIENWRRTRSLAYTVRATEPVSALSMAELRTQYFSVGVGEDLIDLPFTDVLVVFSMIKQTVAALKARKDKPAEEFKIQFSITTHFSDDDAANVLSGMRVETPFDAGPFLGVAESD